MDAALTWGEKIPIGLLYRDGNPRPSLHIQDPGLQGGPLATLPPVVSREQRPAPQHVRVHERTGPFGACPFATFQKVIEEDQSALLTSAQLTTFHHALM